MKRTKFLNLICFILCAVLMLGLFSGCIGDSKGDSDADTTPDATDTAFHTPTTPRDTGVPITVDSVFTLKYDPNSSFNPITGESADNMVISQLFYEGLFKLDANFNAVNVLCDTFSTADGITYNFTIKSGVAMHDGSVLSASDVVYSLQEAKASTKYSSRLAGVQAITATGDLTFTVVLSFANFSLPVLLDVPIIKDGSVDSSTPPGTGPYQFNGDTSSPRLNAFRSYRDFASLQLSTISLTTCETKALTEAFSTELIDFLLLDPTGETQLTVRRSYEARFFDTTVLQYIGLNCSDSVLSDSELRRAINHIINRESLCKTVMDNQAIPANCILSPALSYYDTAWESGKGYSVSSFSGIMEALKMQDSNKDGYLEYATSSFTLDFIVNQESTYKVAAAQNIADSMNSMGIHVVLRVLPWAEYLAALTNGDFDMYYAEVQLPADFNFNVLLTTLNYGGISDATYSQLLLSFLGAAKDTDKAAAAGALCNYVYEKSPIIPILYKKYEVMTQRGMIKGIVPVQSDVFGCIANWSVSFH